MTLCRSCHRKIHEGLWKLDRSSTGIRVLNSRNGKQIMRRLYDTTLDASSLFQVLNLAEESLKRLLDVLPVFTDEQLVDAFGYVKSFGKRSWLVQAAILYEAQKRSTYGEQTLEAISRRFEIGLRQAQKYALVWKVFFCRDDEEKSANIDVFVLDEPSWYVIAATETQEPEKWLAYAQDRKMEDLRYSVTAFRRDIQIARWTQGVAEIKEIREGDLEFHDRERWGCPWIKLLCTKSGKPTPYGECEGCEFRSTARSLIESKNGGNDDNL